MKVAILFGGRSGEHEVSIMSAQNVMNAIDKSKHEIVPIKIDKEGLWEGMPFFEGVKLLQGVDVAFPVLHGPFGEDGTIQGVLEIAGIPYVGASVLGSAIALDKDVTKRLLRDANIPIAKFLAFKERPDFDTVVHALGLPVFIKPATMGSSIGITKAFTRLEFEEGLHLAFSYDSKILIEETIIGRELECAVLGLEASLPGEIIPRDSMQTYESKYFTSGGARYILPVQLSPEKTKEIQELALKAFNVLCCDSMARVDFFMDQNEKLYINEINTLPGFTNLSVYPRLWEASGLSQTILIERLLELALEKPKIHIRKRSIVKTPVRCLQKRGHHRGGGVC